MLPGEALSLDELPRHSPWPRRLLGIDPWPRRTKERAEVLREFESEKWAPLVAALTDGEPADLATVLHRLHSSDHPVAAYVDGDLRLLDAVEAVTRLHDLATRAVLEVADGSSAIVELGAGFAPTLLGVGRRLGPDGPPLIAGELTPSGRAAATAIAKAEAIDLDARACDIAAEPIMTAPPPGSVLFTVYALHYIEPLSADVIERMAAWDPLAVVHVEPVAELLPTDTLLGLLQRRYLELNGYTTNILTTLRTLEDQRRIRIDRVEGPLFGPNALLPCSIICWRPTG